ncbi:hypothetical protein OCU04_012189 [Sclerotinia nivalis]|uniref:Uncharacterized protein n=1 Tax=Sclerotinia nivalis TaxID=352851 RepID=A0A9X0AE69_9HELO|nr:hypothetical protein OCU04_012189 [Sclerotinia nivalis]
MANQTSIWRSISWSKKNKTISKNKPKDLPKLDTSLANTKINSTDPLTPPSDSQSISPRTVVNDTRRVGNRSPITPPQSPRGGILGDDEFEFGYGDRGGDGEGSSGSSKENEKPFQRSIDRDIKRMVEGPDIPSPVSGEWEKEVCEVFGQGAGEVEEVEVEREVQAQAQVQVQVVSKDVQGKSGENGKRRRIWRRNFWRGKGIGKGKDKRGEAGKGDDGLPSGLVRFNTVYWGPKEMGSDKGKENEKEKEKENEGEEEEEGEKQRSKSDGQAKRPKNIEEGEKEGISVRRWIIPGFRKNALEAMKAQELESESERLERERRQERQKRNIEHKEIYPDSVLDDVSFGIHVLFRYIRVCAKETNSFASSFRLKMNAMIIKKLLQAN